MTPARPAAEPLRCITCADEGIEMRVVTITQCGAHCRAADGTDQRVEIELVEPVAVGDRLLVHAGVAIARLEDVR
jgi:hydrogenase maturation factor